MRLKNTSAKSITTLIDEKGDYDVDTQITKDVGDGFFASGIFDLAGGFYYAFLVGIGRSIESSPNGKIVDNSCITHRYVTDETWYKKAVH